MSKLSKRLDDIATQAMPADLDLWPAIQERVQTRRSHKTGQGARLCIRTEALASCRPWRVGVCFCHDCYAHFGSNGAGLDGHFNPDPAGSAEHRPRSP